MPSAPATGGGRQAETCSLGVTGLQAIHTVFAEQGVLVRLLQGAVHEAALCGDCQQVGVAGKQVGGQHRHVACSRQMARGSDAGRGDEVRIVQAQRPRVVVHVLRERRLRSSQVTGQRERGIVAGNHHQALQQSAEGDAFAGHQAHPRFIVGHVVYVARIDGDRVRPRTARLREQVIRGVGRHQLGQRGRRSSQLGVLLLEDLEGESIDRDR
ncbi:hypothetical protein D3C72_1569200 [compost metagenome]